MIRQVDNVFGWLLVVACSLLGMCAEAQVSPGAPGLRNPTSFETGDTLFYWSVREGERLMDSADHADTTSGYHIMNTCKYLPYLFGDSTIGEVMKQNGSFKPYDATCLNSFVGLYDFSRRRVQIIDEEQNGVDTFTRNEINSGMMRIPPGYTSTIKLGSMVPSYERLDVSVFDPDSIDNYSHLSAQNINYTMRVTPDNVLLMFYYAVVARQGPHDAWEAGEFLIRVVRRGDDGEWMDEPINDNLWYKVSAPHTGTDEVPAPWVYGRFDATECSFVYKPWSKVAVSLDEYLGEDVRIEMYSAECVHGMHSLYAYISGDYSPMQLYSTGCSRDGSTTVDTIVAPADMQGYVWFASRSGAVADIYDHEAMNNVQWRRVYPPSGQPPSTSNWFTPNYVDFVLSNGDTVEEQTFMCIMNSALDPAKPIQSKLYVNVQNHKPVPRFHYVSGCNQMMYLYNDSYVYGSTELDRTKTYWVIYGEGSFNTPMDTVWTDYCPYRFPHEGNFGVKLYTVSEDSCASSVMFYCHVPASPMAEIEVEKYDVCEGDPVVLSCVGYADLTKFWTVGDSIYQTTGTTPLSVVLPPGDYVIGLRIADSNNCESKSNDTVHVHARPWLKTEPPTGGICPGDTMFITAMGNASNWWNAEPWDPDIDSQQGENTIKVSPQVSTIYSLVTLPGNVCPQESAHASVGVMPWPEPDIRVSSNELEYDEPSLVFIDSSLYRNSTDWFFSDGAIDSGQRVAHRFMVYDEDSVRVRMHTCNIYRCCADTEVSRPVVRSYVWFPNAFTPSLDENNRFGIVTARPLVEYEIYIYNRYGFLVHKSTDPMKPWDGTKPDGTPCPQGVYSYVYRYSFYGGSKYHGGKGIVTLIR